MLFWPAKEDIPQAKIPNNKNPTIPIPSFLTGARIGPFAPEVLTAPSPLEVAEPACDGTLVGEDTAATPLPVSVKNPVLAATGLLPDSSRCCN